MPTTVFVRQGDAFAVTNDVSLDIHERLPVGCYTIKQRPLTGELYFQSVEPFNLPTKLYGDVEQRAARILSTAEDRVTSTGVLLTGEKGSGKTQLARLLSVRGGERGFVTLIINDPLTGDAFAQLLQAVQQPCMVLFDEIEKVYDDEEQQKLLTVLDGVLSSKKLFVMTCNDKWRINEHMRNRPGRVYYMYEYKGLADQFIIEYCNDQLNNKTHITKLCTLAKMFAEFNFDMLKAIVEEMNRYDESPEEVVRVLNVRPASDDHGTYLVTLSLNGRRVDQYGRVHPRQWSGSPMNEESICVHFNPNSDKDTDDDGALVSTSSYAATSAPKHAHDGSVVPRLLTRSHQLRLTQANLVRFDGSTQTFEYVAPDGFTVEFTRTRPETAKFDALLV